jgi:hypothetical protein
MMLLGMTTATKRNEVIQSVISGFLRACCSVPVNMVNVQIVFAAAMLASVVITLQGSLTVSAEVVVVCGFVGVLLQSVFVRRKPLMDSANFIFALAGWAAMLRTRAVLKIIAAFRAHQNCTDRSRASGLTQFLKVFDVFLASILWLAGRANLLAGAGRRILSFTNQTLAIGVGHDLLHSRNIRIVA